MLQRPPVVVAIPELHTYHNTQTGIGRVLHSLREHWGARVRPVDAGFGAFPVPLLRNTPFAVRAGGPADLVLLPKLTGAQALRRTGQLPSMAIVHDIGIVDFAGDRTDLGWATYQSILQSFHGLRYATRIVAVSRFSGARLAAHLPATAGRIRVVPNGIAPTFLDSCRVADESRRCVERSLGGPLGTPILLYVGSEGTRKNIPLLLRVFREIKACHPAAQLIKVGKAGHPRQRARTVRLAEELGLDLGRDVLLLEDVDDERLADLYRSADVFVSTSLYEGFGLPALEALAAGTPVVVTNRGAFPEVVGTAGWVVEPELKPFVAAIGAVLARPCAGERSRAGRARAAAFTWSRAAEAYLAVMDEVRPREARDMPHLECDGERTLDAGAAG